MSVKPLLPLKLDLQFFAEEFGAYDPSTAYEGIPTPQPQNTDVQPQVGQGEGVPATGEGTQPLVTPAAEPQLLDFGGRKLPANEDLSGLHKDFTEQQRYITSLQEQVNAYKQLAERGQVQPQETQQAQPEPVSSDIANWDEETWQKFYDKPNEILGNVVNQAVQKAVQQFASEKLDPIIQERQWNNEIQRMYDTYGDFDQFIGDVQALVNQNPDRYADGKGGLEEAYFRAKATRGMTDPAQIAQDPQFLQQYVLNNPNVQQQIMNQYFQTKQQTNQQIPVTMGRNAGGFTPQTPDASPQTLKEASRAFLKQLGTR
jgi:hypothetical protein